MRRILLLTLVLLLAAADARAQGRIRGGSGKEKDRVKMVPRKGDPEKGSEEKSPAEQPEKEPEPVDPFEAALSRLATWPSGEAREAATALALRGPDVEPRLIEKLVGSSPALAVGICFVLGEIGGDASLPAVQAQAARPDMVPHLAVLFGALSKLDGLGAVRRIMPFLRHPRRHIRLMPLTDKM